MRGVSEDFKAELGRANYVTPTSYLELITMFQRLVTAKRVENSKSLSRYTVGLDKLQSSAQQVAGMQQELRVGDCMARLVYHSGCNMLVGFITAANIRTIIACMHTRFEPGVHYVAPCCDDWMPCRAIGYCIACWFLQ